MKTTHSFHWNDIVQAANENRMCWNIEQILGQRVYPLFCRYERNPTQIDININILEFADRCTELTHHPLTTK